MKDSISDGKVLIIGSIDPWLEAIILEKGAAHITTLDYNKVVSQHPNISTVLPNELNSMFNNGQFKNEADR